MTPEQVRILIELERALVDRERLRYQFPGHQNIYKCADENVRELRLQLQKSIEDNETQDS